MTVYFPHGMQKESRVIYLVWRSLTSTATLNICEVRKKTLLFAIYYNALLLIIKK